MSETRHFQSLGWSDFKAVSGKGWELGEALDRAGWWKQCEMILITCTLDLQHGTKCAHLRQLVFGPVVLGGVF